MSSPTIGTSTTGIRAVIDARVRALHDRDVDAFLACFTDDCVTYSLAAPLKGVNDGGAFLREWFDRWETPIGNDVTDLDIRISGDGEGDVAFATSLDRMHGRQHDQPDLQLWMRVTLGFVRRDGRWLIAHQHQSVPFAMDGSFAALVDLEP